MWTEEYALGYVCFSQNCPPTLVRQIFFLPLGEGMGEGLGKARIFW